MFSGKTLLAGVVGWPVSHSLSPGLHGFWLAEYGIDGAYLPLSVRPEDLEAVLRCLPRMGFAGVNVTVPHKEAAFAIVDRTDAACSRIGAVNTVVVAGDGTLTGSNTDGFGFMENLAAGVPGWRAEAGPGVVLGAGGAARGVCWALVDAGVPEIRLVNRTRARAEALAGELGEHVRVFPWEARAEALMGARLLVNTTVLGMTDQDPLVLDLDDLPTDALVYDIVYSPLETGLLAAARARGNPIVDGLGMLLHQARPGFAAWFGRAPEVTEDLRRAVSDTLAK